MIWISADKIHDGIAFLPSGTCILINASGLICDIQPLNNLPDVQIKLYHGWITPGFINTHCHLELSHLHGKINKGEGIVSFILEVMKHRSMNYCPKEIQSGIEFGISLSKQNGIVAIGDICNNDNTIDCKLKTDIYCHSFIECMGVKSADSERVLQKYQKLLADFSDLPNENNSATLTPHAPYSVSRQLLGAIVNSNANIFSIHNQESEAENTLLASGQGDFLRLYNHLNIPLSETDLPKSETAFQSFHNWINDANWILVHNTFIQDTDIAIIKSKKDNYYLCLCPNANLYIENQLPPIDKIFEAGITLCLGTDSLASNDTLDILSEMITIKTHFPHISWEEIIKWSTHHGAKALQIDHKYGRIAIGKKPGINLLNINDRKITPLY